MATISLYNHTTRLFADGTFVATDLYKVILCTSATFVATDTTLASITKTEVAAGNGYTAGGAALANVAVTTLDPNGAKFDADDLKWTATNAGITAAAAILYNDSSMGSDPPIAFIDFGGSRTVSAGNDFVLAWDSNGIFVWIVAS
jgi:hypothetical protein